MAAHRLPDGRTALGRSGSAAQGGLPVCTVGSTDPLSWRSGGRALGGRGSASPSARSARDAWASAGTSPPAGARGGKSAERPSRPTDRGRTRARTAGAGAPDPLGSCGAQGAGEGEGEGARTGLQTLALWGASLCLLVQPRSVEALKPEEGEGILQHPPLEGGPWSLQLLPLVLGNIC